MRINQFVPILLIISSSFLVSVDINKKKALYYFNSLKQLEGVKLSYSPGVYESDLELTVDAGPLKGLSIQTINKRGSQTAGKKIKITEPTVLKIKYTDKDGKRRNFVGSYIVNQGHDIPIVSLVVDSNQFFSPDGIYVGHTESNSSGGPILTVGRAWDKQPITASAEFIFNGKVKEQLELDLKTYGGMTLGWKEKSLQLSARKKLHGESEINVKLFENLPFRKFQHVVLRTSGNDQNKTRIKDMSISQVGDDINVNTKASRQVVLYINGQYWGIHNLREKVNGDYFRYRYDWKIGEFREIQGSGFRDTDYKSFIDYVRENSDKSDFHQRVSDSIDVENFFNFNVLQTFISNPDYRGNIRFFKNKGGKWKWVIYDTDLGCKKQFLTRNFIRDRTFPVREYWYNPSYAVTLMNNMMKNDKFKKRFINQYCYLLSTYVSTENFHSKLDQNKANIESEIDRHLARRGALYNESRHSWSAKIKNLKTYFTKRPESAYRHIAETFGFKEAVSVKVNQNITSFNGLRMNGSELLTNSVEGKFFTEYSVDLEAVESDHLYRFKKWSDGNSKSKRVIQPGKAKAITAQFKHKDASPLNSKLVIDKYYVNNSKKNSLLFVGITNMSSEPLNLEGFVLYEDISGRKADLKGKILDPGKSMVLTNDCELFNKKCKNSVADVIKFMEGMTFVNDVKLTIIDKENKWVDSLQVHISDSLLIEHAGYIVIKDNVKTKIKDMKITGLEQLKFGADVPTTGDLMGSSSSFKLILCCFLGLLAVVFGWLMSKRKTRNKELGMLLILALFAGKANSQTSVTGDTVEYREDQFGTSSIENRLIDNKGRGDERFDGTRNFRVVLYDLVYRGGGNNLHLKDTIPKYYLWNPMPLYGLRQLHDIGFDKAVYLYSHNFEYWYPQTRLDSLDAEGFEYICRPKLNSYLDTYLSDVYERVNDSAAGMMYMHCWNGWHQSGLISAYTLMQFCDYTNDQALKYWEKCTDGNYKGFPSLKKKIREYKPSPDYTFTDAQKKKHCPCSDVSANNAAQSADDKINLTTDEMMEKHSSGSSKSYEIYKVRSGDNLFALGEKFGMSVSELQKLNHIRGTMIFVGQKLKVYNRKGVKIS